MRNWGLTSWRDHATVAHMTAAKRTPPTFVDGDLVIWYQNGAASGPWTVVEVDGDTIQIAARQGAVLANVHPDSLARY